MKFARYFGIVASALKIVCAAVPGTFATEKEMQVQNTAKHTHLAGSAVVPDICSKEHSSLMRDLGPHKPIEAIVCGDVLFQMKNGQKTSTWIRKHYSDTETQDLRIPIMSGMFYNFMKQKEIVGQANLTIQINADRSFNLLTQTIYVPGCAPYSGGAEIPSGAKEFYEQIKSAVATIALSDLTIVNSEVEYEIFEIVIGRDPQIFPRNGTLFKGLFTVDEDGNVRENNTSNTAK